ncbi:hypothetical protein [Methylosinus sp. Ce-a6]|uniref:hypothetical protein n=1 Tax=Methylosinus sp. Ce-a6 TaxID=2172005 RepID=UPI00135C7C41|nr:hypothetical protein [Methylosinus sp. Ce-a6]
MRLGKWHQAITYAALIVVAASGVSWFALHDFLEEEPGNLQRALLTVHGVSAFVTLMVVGSVLPLHVRAFWLGKRNIATGASLLLVMTLLIVTALFLYYGGEDSRTLARWTHIGVGLLVFGLLPLHVVLGRKARSKPFAVSRTRPAESRIHSSISPY